MKLTLLPFFIFACINLNAQVVTVELSRKDGENEGAYNDGSYYFPLHKRLYPLSTREILKYPLKSKEIKSSGDLITTITTHELRDTSLAILADMFGHEIILIPNDTVRIYMTKEPSSTVDPKPWTRKLSFSGKNKFIHALFDSLSYNTQDVMSHMLNLAGNTPQEFIKLVEERYNKRVNYLKGYSERHGIPINISDLVLAEIYSAYVKDLAFLQGALTLKGLDIQSLINPKISIEKLKSALFLRTVSADHVIYQYLLCLQVPIEKDFYNNNRLLKVYDLIKSNYAGEIRDNLLSEHVTTFIRAAYKNPDMKKVIMQYRLDCNNPKAIRHVDSLVTVKESLTTVTLQNILESKVQGLNGDFKSINDILKGKPALIDCWASWCNPCIAQFPSSKLLEQEFKDRINFVYLSFDQNLAAWKTKSKELGITHSNYHVAGGFKSLFSEYFSITTIPRYILIDAKGNLVSKDASRPGDPRLKEILNELLDKGSSK